MDPLTITSTVIAISARCVQTARALYDLRGKYKDAAMLITAIYTETIVISTSLASIQGLCTRNPDALRSTLNESSDLSATFDQALTGCVLVYSVLDDEVHRLYAEIAKDGIAGAMARMKFIWKEDMMRDVLVQIRGQQTALSLMIQLLQIGSMQDVQVLMQNNTAVLQNVAHQTSKFRQANPRVKAPSSVFQAEFDDVASLYTTDSSATSTNFDFDDLVVNSQAYRRALLQSKSSQKLDVVPEQPETTSDSATIVGSNKAEEDYKKLFADNEVLKEKYQKVKRYFFEQQTRVNELESQVAAYLVQDKALHEEKEHAQKTQVHQLESQVPALISQVAALKSQIKALQEEKEHQLSEHKQALSNLFEEKDAQLNRVLAEKQDVELLMLHLQDKEKKHAEFFLASNAKRQVLIESYQAELKLKAEAMRRLSNTISENKVKIENQSEMIAELQKNLESAASSKETERGLQAHVEELEAKCLALTAELQQYESLNPIIEQLKLLSPKLHSSPEGASAPPNRATPSAAPQS